MARGEGGPRAGGEDAGVNPRAGSEGELRIAGLVPFSSVDWPGKLVATAFLQGCPWRCVYCQNRSILDPRAPGQVDPAQLTQLVASRAGLLDGVVFSGGEPLLQAAQIAPVAARIHDAGMRVGLHTGGGLPSALGKLLDAGVLDWVGLDVKALPGDFGAVCGVAPAAGRSAAVKVARSQRMLAASGIDYEVRVTAFPGGTDWVALARRIADEGAPTLALQQARAKGAPPQFATLLGTGWDAQFAELAKSVETEMSASATKLVVR